MEQVIKHTNVIHGQEWAQKQEVYRYLPRDNKPPKLVANSLADLVSKLHDEKVEPRHIKNELLKGKNAQTKEEIYKIFLDRTGYFLNPTKDDFERANKMEGLAANANLKNVKFQEVNAKALPSKKQQQQDPWQQKAINFLREQKFALNKANVKYIADNLKGIAKFNKQAQIETTPERSLLLEMRDPKIKKQISQRLSTKNKSLEKAQEEVIKEFPLKGQNFKGLDAYGNQTEFSAQYVDFKKLGKESLEENTELQRTATESLKEGSRYGLLVTEEGSMMDSTNTVYPLTAEYLNDNVTLTNKTLAKKARQIGQALQSRGANKTKATFGELGLDVDFDALKKADPEPKVNKALYKQQLMSRDMEL